MRARTHASIAHINSCWGRGEGGRPVCSDFKAEQNISTVGTFNTLPLPFPTSLLACIRTGDIIYNTILHPAVSWLCSTQALSRRRRCYLSLSLSLFGVPSLYLKWNYIEVVWLHLLESDVWFQANALTQWIPCCCGTHHYVFTKYLKHLLISYFGGGRPTVFRLVKPRGL